MDQNITNNGSQEEGLHTITSESSDLKHKAQPATTAVENGDISLQEQKELAGLGKTFGDESSNGLISKEHQYYHQQSQSEGRDLADSAVARTIFVLAVVGVFVLSGLFLFIGFGSSGNKESANQVESKDKAEMSEESDTYKARLAVVGQKQDQQQANTDAYSRAAQLEQTSRKEPPKRKVQPSARQRPERVERLVEPRQTRTFQRSQPQPSRPNRKPPAPKPVVDPQQRWNLLAAAGTQQSGAEVISAESSQNRLGTSSLQTQSDTPDSDRQVSDTVLSETQDIPISDRQVSLTGPTGRISRVVIGGQPQVVSNNNAIASGSQAVVLPEQEQQTSQTGNITLSDLPGYSSSSITAGAQGIIQRQQQPITASQLVRRTSYEVPIGSTASARVSVPIIWSEDGSSPTAGRFAVTLSEPLIALNGEIALPKDTVLITEVTEITPDSYVVHQSAVAIVYRDRAGRIQQQEIPPHNLIIRGDRNQPLIAKGSRQSNAGVLKQDLLVGALSSLGKIGEIINRPEEEIVREDDGFDSYRRERRTSSDERDVLAAALEGFFDATADRIGKRSERSVQQQLARKPVLVVPEGEKATVYVNSFLEVKR